MPEHPGEGMTASRETRPAPTHTHHTGELHPTTEFTHRSPAAPSLRRAGPRSRPFVLATLRALRLDRRPSPGAARTEAEKDENNTTNCLDRTPPFRDDYSSCRFEARGKPPWTCVAHV